MSGDAHDDHSDHGDDHGHHPPAPYFGEAVPENQLGVIIPALWIVATLAVGVISAIVAASNEFGW